MARQFINISTPNDGSGTPIRTAFDYINDNFLEAYGGISGLDAVSGDFALSSELSNYVTVSSGDSLNVAIFTLQSQTGSYYPSNNPSGFVTGAGDLSDYALVTDLFSTGQSLETSIFALESETGNYYPYSNPSGYMPSGQLVGVGTISVFAQGGSLYVSGDSSVGEANTASNLGTGEGVYAQKSSVDLQFKSLVPGTGISFTASSDEIAINFNGELVSNTGELTGVFYPLGTNPSGYITNSDLTPYALTSTLNSSGAALEADIFELQAETGNYYPRTNPSGYVVTPYVFNPLPGATGVVEFKAVATSGVFSEGNIVPIKFVGSGLGFYQFTIGSGVNDIWEVRPDDHNAVGNNFYWNSIL